MTAPKLRFKEFDEDWAASRIDEIASVTSGGTPSRSNSEYWDGNIPWVTTSLVDFNVIQTAEEFITQDGLKNSSAKLFPKNTILMAMYGATAGKTSVISFEASTNQAICAVMPKSNNLFHYTKFFLDDMYQYLINLSTGSARDNLSQDKIKNLDIVIPKEEILISFSPRILFYYKKIENNLKENQQLINLRDWLLPMLMNGQIKVE